MTIYEPPLDPDEDEAQPCNYPGCSRSRYHAGPHYYDHEPESFEG